MGLWHGCVLLWVYLLSYSCAFSVGSHILKRRAFSSASKVAGSLDYEYIPPDTSSSDAASSFTFSTNLESSYPEGTPAGLRGEALHSALRSHCVGWNLAGSPLEHGVVQVTGRGTLDFVNHKLTTQIPKTRSKQQQQQQLKEEDENVNSDYYYHHYKEACLLTARGRLVDRIGVATASSAVPNSGTQDEEEDAETTTKAYMLTSPGHSSQALFDRLDPFIFPLDQVQLRCYHEVECTIFSLAATDLQPIQTCFEQLMAPRLGLNQNHQSRMPKADQCLQIPLPGQQASLLIVPNSGLPSHAGAGYTFCFLDDQDGVGAQMWRHLSSDDCPEGPVVAGALEFETLRIEAGQVAYGKEMTGSQEKNKEADVATPASPLELHLEATIDFEKGCYLGQEGIASILKNPRGPPRTLYHVVFDDEFNVYDQHPPSQGGGGEPTTTSKKRDKNKNRTRIPVAGDQLFVLGSNETIAVGQITSVAEPAGTGEPETLALALVRRADSIRRQMQTMDLQMPWPSAAAAKESDDGSGIIAPPPLDPLDGLEVIVGGTFTVGRLRMVPSRRKEKNAFGGVVPEFVKNLPGEEMQNDIIDVSSRPIKGDSQQQQQKLQAEELAKAKSEAEAAAAEAKRKAEKMEELRKRAEEAVARRKNKKAT